MNGFAVACGVHPSRAPRGMHPSRAPLAVRQERQKLLSFVIVGGGPTGVEVAAEMHDMIRVSQGLGFRA